MTREEMENRMSYHSPSPDGVARHLDLSNTLTGALVAIERNCPEGREKSLAITKIEEAKFWASAAVARNPETC